MGRRNNLPDKIRLFFSSVPPNLVHLLVNLYAEAYPLFTTYSNLIHIDTVSRLRFDRRCKDFLDYLKSGNYTHLQEQYKQNYSKGYYEVILALIKALDTYLAGIEALNIVLPIETEVNGISYILTKRPPNLIADALKDTVRDIEEMGRHISSIMPNFHIVRKDQPRINLILLKDEDVRVDLFGLFLGRENDFKIAVTPFTPHIRYKISSLKESYPQTERIPFWFDDIENHLELKDKAIEILEECIKENVTILIFPELTINENLLTEIGRWLSTDNKDYVLNQNKGLLLVVAGSFHFICEDGKVNRSIILGYDGKPLWYHDKMQAYQITRDDVNDDKSLIDKLRIGPGGGEEGIALKNELRFIDLPIGRVSVCICLDYIYLDHFEAIKESGINVFLIPAMSSNTTRFHEYARDFGNSQHASTFVSNSSYIAINPEGASFYYIPSRDRSYYPCLPDSLLLIFDYSMVS